MVRHASVPQKPVGKSVQIGVVSHFITSLIRCSTVHYCICINKIFAKNFQTPCPMWNIVFLPRIRFSPWRSGSVFTSLAEIWILIPAGAVGMAQGIPRSSRSRTFFFTPRFPEEQILSLLGSSEVLIKIPQGPRNFLQILKVHYICNSLVTPFLMYFFNLFIL